MEEAEIRATLHELIDAWHDSATPVQMSLREHVLVGLTIYGLTAHTYTAVEGALALHEAGHSVAATPLARQAVECATTAAWVELAGYPAALALLQDQARNSKNAVAAFVKSGAAIDPALSERLAADLAAAFATNTGAGQKFEQRCTEIEGGETLYAVYRAMSATCHAGASVVDLYAHQVEPTDANRLGLALSTRPKVGPADTYLGMLLMSLVTATSAWSRLDRARTHRSRMKALNRQLGTSYEKRLSAAGFGKMQVRERELKRWEAALRTARASSH